MAEDRAPLVDVTGLTKSFAVGTRKGAPVVHAAAGLDFEIFAGDCFGVVGESGSGKTTLANMLLGLLQPDAGSIRFEGAETLPPHGHFPHGRIQVVFQDPRSSLDPHMTVADILREPLVPMSRARREAVGSDTALAACLDRVGLPANHLDRFGHEFSGGQRQRIAIARALVTEPRLIVLDEPTSALDVSVQAQILNLLLDLRAALGLTYVFISHDLAVVRYVCNVVAVLDQGSFVELGPPDEVFDQPKNAYTRRLVSATPTLGDQPVRALYPT